MMKSSSSITSLVGIEKEDSNKMKLMIGLIIT